MLTPFGMAVRKLRIERGDSQKTMAERVGQSQEFLSAVMNGRRRVPRELVQDIIHAYALPLDKAQALRAAAERVNRRAIKVQVRGVSQEARELVMALARNFDAMPQGSQEKIRKILKAEEH